jgi:hypothetical protein
MYLEEKQWVACLTFVFYVPALAKQHNRNYELIFVILRPCNKARIPESSVSKRGIASNITMNTHG